MSLNVVQEPNPENWAIIDGKLYLNTSKEGIERIVSNPEPVIAAAEENWKTLSTEFDRSEWNVCPTCETN